MSWHNVRIFGKSHSIQNTTGSQSGVHRRRETCSEVHEITITRSCHRLVLACDITVGCQIFRTNMTNWIGHGYFPGGNRSWGQNNWERTGRDRLINDFSRQACRSWSNRWQLVSTYSRHAGAALSNWLILLSTHLLCIRRTFATLNRLCITTTRSWQQWINNRRQPNSKNQRRRRRSKLWTYIVQLQNEDGSWPYTSYLAQKHTFLSHTVPWDF